MRLDGVEHWDHFQDETIYWLDLSDMPEPIQQAARRIDGKAYNDRCFGICVVHDLATNEYAVVTESGTSPEVDRNIFYVDNDGDKHWFQADLPDTLVKEMFSCCEDVHAGKLLPQGYQALSSVLFDNETGFVSGENQAAKSPFSTWQLRIDHGHPEYYTPHYHTDRESAEQDLNGRVAEYKRYHTIREKNGEFAYLYPYSKAEAGRRGELDRWEESFRANVSCAREIEAAIRGYSSGDGILQPGTARNILEQWGFKRTNFVLANTLQQLGPIKDRLSEANRNWQRGAYIPQDGTNRYFAVDTALICMDQFISQVRDAYIRNCLKRVRKKESAMLLASQNLEDFNQEGIRELTKPLFAIPPHQFLFNAGAVDKKFYMEALQLEESEYNLIRFPQRGVCLYRCGNERYLLEVHAPAYKEALFGKAGGR